jgi:hypothetical protein
MTAMEIMKVKIVRPVYEKLDKIPEVINGKNDTDAGKQFYTCSHINVLREKDENNCQYSKTIRW